MNVDIDIDVDPRDLTREELLDCVNYANQLGIGFIDPLFEEERVKELLRDMYEYFYFNKHHPVPEPVRKFIWYVLGKLV